jgi:RND family efflux transporter MFP subunit
MEDRIAQRRRVWVRPLVIALVVLAGAAVALTVRRAGGSSAPKTKTAAKEAAPPAPVELSQVRRGPIATYVQSTATLEPRNSAVLVARRQGQVVSLLVEEGGWVERGQLLARLDDRETQLALNRSELAADLARRELERARQLDAKGFLSAKELDELDVKLKSATVDLEQARYDHSQMTLVAPFAGRVVDRLINQGETVPVGKECFRIADFDPVLVRIYFPERELPHVRPGQEATLTFDSQPGASYTGRVSLVSPVVDRSNGTFKVTLEVPNRTGALRPGTFAHVRVKTGQASDAILMPRRGVLTEDGEDYVFVARGDSVMRQTVRLGAVQGDVAQIVHGLAGGEQVVTVGQGGLKPGSKIRAVRL